MFILFRFNFVGKFFITRVTLLKLLLQQFYCLIAICLPLPSGPWSIISLLSSLHLSGKEQVIVTPHKDKNSQIQRLPVIFHTRKVSLPFTYTKSEIIWIGFTLNERNSIHTKFTLNELNWIQNRDFAQRRREARQFSFPGTRTVCVWRLGTTLVHTPSEGRRSYSRPLPEFYSWLDFPKTESKAKRERRQLNYKVWLGSSAVLLSQLSSAHEHDGSWTPRYFQSTTWQSRRTSHVT